MARMTLGILALVLALEPGIALAFDEPGVPLPGTLLVVRGPGRAVRLTARAGAADFELPGASNLPTVEGGQLQVFDLGFTGGFDAYPLPAAGWVGLGSPPGATGYRYRGSGAAGDPCRLVLVRKRVVRAVCVGPDVTLAPPFAGDANVLLTLGTGSKNYCAMFGGTTKANVPGLLKRKSAPPGICPIVGGSTTTTTTIPTCNAAERFTLTSSAGTLHVDNLPPFPFPAGITTVLDSGPAVTGLPECRHDVIMPAGGFVVPNFAFGNLNYCVQITSLGCESGGALGQGALWDGAGASGLALTDVSKVADTSDGTCNPAGQPCTTAAGGAGANTLGQIVTTRSPSAGGGTRYAVDTRLRTIIWSDSACSPSLNPPCCTTSTYNPADGDLDIQHFEALVTLTTGTATAAFADLNGDTCRRAGSGFDPAPPGADGPKSVTGAPAPGPYCVVGQSTTAAVAGVSFSGGPPLFDLGFRITIPNTVSGCGAAAPGSCTLTSDPCLG